METFSDENVSFLEQSAVALLADFDAHYSAIKTAEQDLYDTPDRHLQSDDVKRKETALHNAIEAFLDKMPRVFDPFAGGGAIPLEASRLGCRSFGNDINPVAHIIQKGSLEFPQKYGKPITYSRAEFIKLYGEDEFNRTSNENLIYENGTVTAVKISNRLAFDVEFYTKELLKRAEAEIGHFYPADENGKKPIAYYWARVATCSNPSCRAEVPLLKSFYLANTKNKQIYLKPILDGTKIDFEIRKGGSTEEGWVHSRKNLRCPICLNNTSNAELKRQFLSDQISERMLAVVEDSDQGKSYRIPTKKDREFAQDISVSPNFINGYLPIGNTKQFDLCPWGFTKYRQMFSARQLKSIEVLVRKLDEIKGRIPSEDIVYAQGVSTSLGILINKIAVLLTNFGRWDSTTEHGQSPFSKQAIAMVFDYPEYSPFSVSKTQLDWILRFLSEESNNCFFTTLKNHSSGEREQFPEKFITAVVTDPPYYDAIPYADLSDFFYVLLKHTLANIYPINFATPQTPKSDECTALKHYHDGSKDKATAHFENKLLQIFDAIEHQTSEVVSIMFAHQSTEAWTTLCNSILGAKMNITGSWAVDTELANRSIALAGAALASSVTVSCKPNNSQGSAQYQTVKHDIEKKVTEEVTELYSLGFRGADLLTACFGKAVGEFGKYERVEKASGEAVTVAELLEMTRESALNALLKGFKGDDFTKFYIGWLELYGFTESDFDDAAKFTKVSLSVNVKDLFDAHIFVKNGNKQTLARYDERNQAKKHLGETANASLIDKVHKAMWLYDTKTGNNRNDLLNFIGKVEGSPDSSSFWRVLTSLKELTKGTEDYKQVSELLDSKDSLIRASKHSRESVQSQPSFFN